MAEYLELLALLVFVAVSTGLLLACIVDVVVASDDADGSRP